MLYFSYDNLTGFPEAGKPVFAPIALFYYVSCCHCERREATLGRSPPLRHATRAISPASTGEHTPERVVFRGV